MYIYIYYAFVCTVIYYAYIVQICLLDLYMYMAIAYIDAHFCTELGELGPKPTNVLDCFGMGRTWQYQSTSGVIKRGWKVPEQNGGLMGRSTIVHCHV